MNAPKFRHGPARHVRIMYRHSYFLLVLRSARCGAHSTPGERVTAAVGWLSTRRDLALPPKSSVVGSRKGPHSPPQPSPPAAQSKSPLQPGDDAQAALPPPAAPPRRRGRPLLAARPRCGGGQGGAVGGAHGADGPGGRGGAEPERDAAAAGELPALRALHLLRRAQGRLRPLPVLLRHQLQHPQPPLRILLLHAQVMRLPPLQRLSRPELSLSAPLCSALLPSVMGEGDAQSDTSKYF